MFNKRFTKNLYHYKGEKSAAAAGRVSLDNDEKDPKVEELILKQT